MKRILLLSIFSYAYIGVAFSQNGTESPKSQSKLEVFTSKSGTLIKKEFTDIGTVKTCEVKVLKVTDLISGESFSGVKLSTQTTYGDKSTLLDSDELDGLLKSLNLIKEKILNTTPEIYTEVVYKSRDGFQAGCYNDKNNWSLFLKIDQYDDKTYIWCKSEHLDKMMLILSDAKTKL